MTNLQPSTSVPLTEAIAIKAIRDFFRDKPFVFFGTGMSCALDTRFGMPALTDELIQVLPTNAYLEKWRNKKIGTMYNILK